MNACLQGHFAATQPPTRFALRGFAAILPTYTWAEIWIALRGEFIQSRSGSGSLARQMNEFLFPPEVFGPPDGTAYHHATMSILQRQRYCLPQLQGSATNPGCLKLRLAQRQTNLANCTFITG